MKSTTGSGSGSGSGRNKPGPKDTKKPREYGTPGWRLDLLAEEKGGPKAFIKKVPGLTYNTFIKWTWNKGFTPENQQKVIRAYGLSSDYFSDPDAAEARLDLRTLAWSRFCEGPHGQRMTGEQRSMIDTWIPTMNIEVSDLVFETLLLAIKQGQNAAENKPIEPEPPPEPRDEKDERFLKSGKQKKRKPTDS